MGMDGDRVGRAEPLMSQQDTGRKSGPGPWSWEGAVERHSEVGGGSVNLVAPITAQGPQLPRGENQHPRGERKMG